MDKLETKKTCMRDKKEQKKNSFKLNAYHY